MVTPDRDLHTGRPLWADERMTRVSARPLTRHTRVDVLVVGAGVSGAMIAERLCTFGLDVAIVDKGKPAHGSTLASTCLIQYEIDEPLSRLSDKVGKTKAQRAWRRSRLAVESLAARLRDLDIDCAMERRDSVYLSGSVLNPRELERELTMRRSIGLEGVMVTRRDLRNFYGIRGNAAILSRDNLACNPVQMTRGFLKSAIDQGAELYAPVAVMDIAPDKHMMRVMTKEGAVITAHHVVFATGYEIPRYIKTRRHKIISTWALATAPLALPPDLPMMWEASDPYCYARPTPDGRVLFGGEDEEMADDDKRDALIDRKTKTLIKKLRYRFPDLRPVVTHAWTGFFGASTTGLPSIGRIPGMKNCYAVMAYGGNGITFSCIAADIVAGAIAGRNDPDEDLFAF